MSRLDTSHEWPETEAMTWADMVELHPELTDLTEAVARRAKAISLWRIAPGGFLMRVTERVERPK